jgi:S1/P1 Nuclease
MILKHNILCKKSFHLLIILMMTLYLNGYSNEITKPWGFFAHKKINTLAIYTLPIEMVAFYKRHQREIADFSVLPDQRRYIMDNEASRHYIDLDRYNISEISYTNWAEIITHMNPDSLVKHGIVPWHIPILYQQLKYAFVSRDTLKIIKLSAEMGHYIGDLHVPLHTTSNYDGQKTGQTGLHAFWESRIPELLNEDLEEWVGPATFIPNISKYAWDWVLESHSLVKILIDKEAKLNTTFKKSKKYTFEKKGSELQKNYSIEYSKKYHQLLDHQIEDRFQSAYKHVGDIWFSAWIEAGQPFFK